MAAGKSKGVTWARLAAQHLPDGGQQPHVEGPLPRSCLVGEIVRIALGSKAYQETMAMFGSGDYLHKGCYAKGACDDGRCLLGIGSKEDVGDFLALSILMCNFGLSLEVVRTVKLGALLAAAPALDACPHCGGDYVYAEHKNRCPR